MGSDISMGDWVAFLQSKYEPVEKVNLIFLDVQYPFLDNETSFEELDTVQRLVENIVCIFVQL